MSNWNWLCLVPKGLRKRMGWGCYTCGSYLYFGYGGPDENGERVDYCIDCWPWYECCGFVGCNHYQCEHAEDMSATPDAPALVSSPRIRPMLTSATSAMPVVQPTGLSKRWKASRKCGARSRWWCVLPPSNQRVQRWRTPRRGERPSMQYSPS